VNGQPSYSKEKLGHTERETRGQSSYAKNPYTNLSAFLHISPAHTLHTLAIKEMCLNKK
jgi:hypothetical protein